MKISDRLRKASSKLLVIVVDIDRLSGDEVREVFRLIKSVADFPNVTYLLAFDREAVCRMHEPMQGGTGEEYLEKIVQVPFELPKPKFDGNPADDVQKI
jgi:predicted KAP-like P-loop ATPase